MSRPHRERRHHAANSANATKSATPRSQHCAHPSNGWLHTSRTGRYSTPTTADHTTHIATHTTQRAACSSSQSHGVLNNALDTLESVADYCCEMIDLVLSLLRRPQHT